MRSLLSSMILTLNDEALKSQYEIPESFVCYTPYDPTEQRDYPFAVLHEIDNQNIQASSSSMEEMTSVSYQLDILVTSDGVTPAYDLGNTLVANLDALLTHQFNLSRDDVFSDILDDETLIYIYRCSGIITEVGVFRT